MKNLTTEYNKIAESEVPDLWNRINTSLDEIEKESPKKGKILQFTKSKAFRGIEIGVACACAILLFVLLKPNFTRTASPASTNETPSRAATSPAKQEIPQYEATFNDNTYAEACESEPAYESEIACEKETVYAEELDDDEKEIYYKVIDLGDGNFACNGEVYKYQYLVKGSLSDFNYPYTTFCVLSNDESEPSFDILEECYYYMIGYETSLEMIDYNIIIAEVEHSME